ncbi:MAG: ribulose-phosphate 3-epimerase [Proteobacteria bacterium]|jgi:ribulose-phosphate 3-epimerase|nr:ribulose-phosphate 3-epimerase [Pseudomonadota bacterium]
MNPIIVAPSLLAADCLHFADEVASVEKAGADWHHVDVMDGHFVPNLTFGLPFVAALKKVAKIPLDVHIMVANPDEVALDYVRAGADILVFHIEAARHPHRLCQAIRAAGAKVGIAVNPGTALELVYPLLDDVDVIMLMSVNPGFGGQKFIPQTVERIATLSRAISLRGRAKQVIIEVDGGITAQTAPQVAAAGATALVAGTFVFGANDRAKAIHSLHLAASSEA